MTADKLLEKCTDISKALFNTHEDERKDFMKDTISWKKTSYYGNGGNVYMNDAIKALAEIIFSAREEIDKASAKQAGKGSTRINALKAVAKGVVGMRTGNGLYESNGKHILLDGHRFFRLNEDVSCLPHMDDNMTPFKVEKMLQADYSKEAVLPTIAECKAFISEHKGERKPIVFETDGVKHAFNPKFLLELQQIYPTAKHYFLSDNNSTSPLYSRTDEGEDALTLCVNIG